MIKIDLRKIMQAMPASFLHFTLAVLVSGTVFAGQMIAAFAVYADHTMGFLDNIKRVNLVKQAVRAPEQLNRMSQKDVEILLRTPSLKRAEKTVTAWHYHGESCALDIYFNTSRKQPDYVEFRTLSLNEDIQSQFQDADLSSLKVHCLKDVLDAQGVDVPSSVARHPLPSWDSPYRS